MARGRPVKQIGQGGGAVVASVSWDIRQSGESELVLAKGRTAMPKDTSEIKTFARMHELCYLGIAKPPDRREEVFYRNVKMRYNTICRVGFARHIVFSVLDRGTV